MLITVTVKGSNKCEISEKFAACALEESPKVSTITQYLGQLAQHKKFGGEGARAKFYFEIF